MSKPSKQLLYLDEFFKDNLQGMLFIVFGAMLIDGVENPYFDIIVAVLVIYKILTLMSNLALALFKEVFKRLPKVQKYDN